MQNIRLQITAQINNVGMGGFISMDIGQLGPISISMVILILTEKNKTSIIKATIKFL